MIHCRFDDKRGDAMNRSQPEIMCSHSEDAAPALPFKSPGDVLDDRMLAYFKQHATALAEAHPMGLVRGLAKYALHLKAAAATPAPEPVAWLVLDEDGQPEFAAGWKEAAHEHINDAINEHHIEGAEKWVVRPVFTADAIESLRLDAARLDFLQAEAQKHQVMFAKSLLGTGIELALGYHNVKVTIGDLRAAIDAAIEARKA